MLVFRLRRWLTVNSAAQHLAMSLVTQHGAHALAMLQASIDTDDLDPFQRDVQARALRHVDDLCGSLSTTWPRAHIGLAQ